MAAKFDPLQSARDIVRLVGGPGNVKSLGHCMTRLRFVLADESKVDADALKKVPGVLGAVSGGGQYMVICGKNLLPIYEAANKDFGFTASSGGASGAGGKAAAGGGKKPLTLKSAGSAAIGYVSSSVSTLVPGLVAGGMLKVALLLVSMALPSFKTTSTYTLLAAVADSAFFFMPIFVAFGAASKLGATPVYAMIGAASLLHKSYVGLVAAGNPVNMFGIPVLLTSYSSSLLPALLIALVAANAERLLNKVVPGIFKSLLVGLGTVTVTMILGYTVLAPLGDIAGKGISRVFVFLGSHTAFIAVGALAACLPWLIMCGMHHALVPFMAQAVVDPGYDPVFRPAYIMHNMAEGGACIGVGLRTKNPKLRAEAFSIGFGCIVAGVTEPAVYGINLRLRRPMYGVMAGGAVGGIVGGLLGVRAYVMGYSTILALPIFQDTALKMLIAIAIDIAVAAAVTFVLGFEDDPIEVEDAPGAGGKAGASLLDRAGASEVFPASPKGEATSTADGGATDAGAAVAAAGAGEGAPAAGAADSLELSSPLTGKVMALNEVQDEAFSSGTLGNGCAIMPSVGEVVAPCDGTVSTLPDSHHAVGITTDAGDDILIHVGMNTVELAGKCFTPHVKEGDRVKRGDALISFDIEGIKKAGYPLVTPVVVANSDDFASLTVSAAKGSDVKRGDALLVASGRQ